MKKTKPAKTQLLPRLPLQEPFLDLFFHLTKGPDRKTRGIKNPGVKTPTVKERINTSRTLHKMDLEQWVQAQYQILGVDEKGQFIGKKTFKNRLIAQRPIINGQAASKEHIRQFVNR